MRVKCTRKTAVLQNSLQLELLRICQTKFHHDSVGRHYDHNDDDDEDGDDDGQKGKLYLLDRCVKRAVPVEARNSKLWIIILLNIVRITIDADANDWNISPTFFHLKYV